MKGKPVNFPSDLNSKEFSFQGIDTLSSIVNNDEGSEGSGVPVYGCTDPSATNYNPLATVDDGSCIMPIYGCTDNAATNYNPLANIDDGSCVYPGPTFQITVKDLDDEDPVPIYGCTDPTATNYDPNANTDDGSCILPSSPGFLTTNTAGGPYIALTGGGTWFAGADGGGVPTVPYTALDILFTIKTANLTTATINSILNMPAGTTLSFGDPGTGVQIDHRIVVSVQQSGNWTTPYDLGGSIHIKCSGQPIGQYLNLHDYTNSGASGYAQQVDLFWTI